MQGAVSDGCFGSISIIEVPSHADNQHDKLSTVFLCGRLTKDREWFVQAPSEIQLEDGLVIQASSDLAA